MSETMHLNEEEILQVGRESADRLMMGTLVFLLLVALGTAAYSAT